MSTNRNIRLSSVVIAVTLQRLLENPLRFLAPEEELVLDALRRSTARLRDATNEELADYVRSLSADQLQGVLSNVKGIYHELLFVRAENMDGDGVLARVFESTNHPGADVEFVMDGDVIGEVQLKSVCSASEITEHLSRYPDVEILATSEVADRLGTIGSTGLSNEGLTKQVHDQLGELAGDSMLEGVAVDLGNSALISAAFAANRLLQRKRVTHSELKSVVGDIAVGGTAAIFLDALILGLS